MKPKLRNTINQNNMKNLFAILLVTVLTSCGGSSSSDPADTTKQNAEGLPTDFLGNYHGIQPSYFMKNQYGDDMVINGNKVSVPSIDYKFLLKENNVVSLQQINLDDNSRVYYWKYHSKVPLCAISY